MIILLASILVKLQLSQLLLRVWLNELDLSHLSACVYELTPLLRTVRLLTSL